MITFSVIIPSFNSALTLGRTLDALTAIRNPRVIEIIVSDSSNDSETRKLIENRRKDPRIKTVYFDNPTPPAEARNAAATAANGDYLLFIDADAYPAADWVEAVENLIQHGVQAGGGAIALPPEQTRKTLPRAQYFLQFNEFTPLAKKREVRFVPSCNLFCEKKMFHKVGGFPIIRASEDVILGIELNRHSRMVFDPKIQVYHIFRERWKSFLSNQALLGEYICVYRRDYLKQVFARLPWSVLAGFPLAILKGIKIQAAIIQHLRGRDLLRHVRDSIVMLLGLSAWGWGYIKGGFQKCAR
jgi:glycosyltransferase involved in cell wall biosynthesis